MWRWYHRHPQAPVVAAGGITVYLTIMLMLWGLFGMVFYIVGIVSPRPWRGVLELAFFVFCVYPPLLWSGIRALNGKVSSLWVNTGMLAGLTYLAIGIMANLRFGIAGWEIMAITHSSLPIRLQYGSLLFVFAGIGLLMNVVGLIASRLNATASPRDNDLAGATAHPTAREAHTRTDTTERGA
jgi:hypothetical protein